MRVAWPCAMELSADDVMDHFQAYGRISDMDWLESSNDTETIKLYFESSASIREALQKHKHAVARETDGKLIPVRVCVKFSDNAVKHNASKDQSV